MDGDSTFRETVLSEKQFVFYSGAVTLLSSCLPWPESREGWRRGGNPFQENKGGEINLN